MASVSTRYTVSGFLVMRRSGVRLPKAAPVSWLRAQNRREVVDATPDDAPDENDRWVGGVRGSRKRSESVSALTRSRRSRERFEDGRVGRGSESDLTPGSRTGLPGRAYRALLSAMHEQAQQRPALRIA